MSSIRSIRRYNRKRRIQELADNYHLEDFNITNESIKVENINNEINCLIPSNTFSNHSNILSNQQAVLDNTKTIKKELNNNSEGSSQDSPKLNKKDNSEIHELKNKQSQQKDEIEVLQVKLRENETIISKLKEENLNLKTQLKTSEEKNQKFCFGN